MKIICKKNVELTDEELELFYDLYVSNLDENVRKEYSVYSDENKKIWINNIKDNNQLFCAEYFEENEFVGYIMIVLYEKENYVQEFEIVKKFQGDGKSFKNMVKLILPFTNTKNVYTGLIYDYNHHAKKVFKSIGAVPDHNKYVVDYDRLVRFVDENKVLDDKMH